MADLGSIGGGAGGLYHWASWRVQNNPFPTGEAGGAGRFDKFTYPASEWQLTYAFLFANIDTAGAITGKVYLDTVPLANQIVWLHHRPSGNKLRQVVTDSGGSFVIYGLEQNPDIYYLTTIYGTTAKSLNINITPNQYVEVQLYTMTARRPLVLINGRITEAPDGTTWAVGIPSVDVQSYSQTFGDGSSLSYTITHNLGNQDAMVVVRRVDAPYDEIQCEVEYTSANVVTLRFADTAPTTNQYRVTVLG